MLNENKTVIVTGAGSGIGHAIANAFLNVGSNVVLNGRDERKLEQAAIQFNRPNQIATCAGDITQPETSEKIVQAATSSFGPIDALVNNAGIFFTKPFTEYSVDELDAFLGYLRGTFLLTQAVVRQMQKQGIGGAITNIGTILTENSLHEFPSSAPIAAKGGIIAMTKNLSSELASDNIRINAVSPGLVPTPLYGELSETDLEMLSQKQPLGRYGHPEEIAEAVVFLTNADWITGVNLPVDGGVAAGGDGAFHGARTLSMS